MIDELRIGSRLGKFSTYGKFFGGQVLVQAISLVVGLIVVNQLSKAEYSYYTIIFVIIPAITILGNSGLSSTISSLGAGLRKEKTALSELVVSVGSLRRLLGVGVALVAGPLTWLLLRQNGADTRTACVLVALVLVTSGTMTSYTVYNDLLALEFRRSKIQSISIGAAILRFLGALVLCVVPFKAAAVPIAANTLVMFLSVLFQKKTVTTIVDFTVQVSNNLRKTALANFGKLIPVNLLIVFQGQIIILYLGVLGATDTLAEIGALSRFTTVFAVISTCMTLLAGPIVARAPVERLLRSYATILACATFLMFLLVVIVALFSPILIGLLGKPYAGLEGELVVLFIAGALVCLGETLKILNQARGWIGLSWIQVPFTLVLAALGVFAVDIGTASGASFLTLLIGIAGPVAQAVQFGSCIRKFSVENEPLVKSAASAKISDFTSADDDYLRPTS